MSDLPQPQSYEQFLGDMLSAYAAKLGIDDFNVGSGITGFFEVVALATARASGDVFQILRDFSVDRATGDALKRLATENRVALISAKPATGTVTVTDTSFSKVSTKVYAGANPPNVGSTQIRASDASDFTGAGSIYIGRGTPNVEGPLLYTSITPSGGFFIINLTSPTTKFHNVGEEIILSQGGTRTVPVNTIVLSPAAGASPDVQFQVTNAAVILDGEVSVSGVQVSAMTPGSSGNVPRGAIRQFASPPFSGASVTNTLPFTTGKDSETDDELRVRIKRAIASKGLGTATAIKAAVIGASPSDEQATVVSDEIVSGSDGSTLYIDDGSGYEAKTAGVGLESIVDSALGGEKFFQLATGGRQAPVAKAFLESTFSAPFDLIGGDTLAIIVGEQTFQHVFADTDFRSPGGATAFEVTASINANTTLGFEATTSGGGQYVVIRSNSEGNDTVKTTTPTTSGRDAASMLGLPSNEIQTLRLYKNKVPLSKDGNSAALFTQSQQLWSNTVANGDTLVLAVDGTSAITYTVTDADFIATGLYTSVASTNSLESWVEVFNSKLTGVTVSVVGTQLRIASNLGASNRAQLTIDASSTLVTKGMFSSLIGLSSDGKQSDFVLSRNTAQFELNQALAVGDELSGGTEETEARLISSQIPGGSVTFSSSGYVWLLIDSVGQLIPTGVAGNTFVSIAKPATNVIRYGSTVPNAFSNVQVGDYVIIWSAELAAANRIEGRVNAKTSTTLDILVTPTEWAAASSSAGVLFFEGFVVLRSTLAPQKFRVTAGTKTLDQIVQELQAQTPSLIFSVLEDQYIVVRTRTKDSDGFLLVVTADSQGKLINLPASGSDLSKDSLIAFYESQEKEADFPVFLHALVATGTSADPINSYIASFVSSVSLAARDPNELVAILHPYGAIRDTQPFGEAVQESSISGTTISIANSAIVRRLRASDRYFLANPLDFGSNDTAVVILDNDASSKSFEIPFYRRAKTNTTLVNNPSNFNAYDVESGASASFTAAFGTFDFSNFKVLMQARKVLKHQAAQTALLYRATRFGRSGESVFVAYTYPSAPNSAIGSTIVVDTKVDVKINLKSGAAISTSIDGSTTWNVTITANTPIAGVDQVKYTYSGAGTAPALGSVVGGCYVNITTQTALSAANTGVFRVSTQAGHTPTATTFTVQRPTSAGVVESGKATLATGAISFYAKNDTTAAEINTYANANLADYFGTTIVNDGGLTGAGIVQFATYEDTNFVSQSVQLKDGINWILSSNLAGSPQFTFKKPLALSADTGYAFNGGEEIRLIPTTMDQTKRLISVLAVTGFTTIGTVGLVDRASRLELATQILGSSGSIQVIGGLANQYQVPVLDSATRVNNSLSVISVDRVSAKGVHSDQWFRLQASFVQKKEALFSSNSSITVFANTPTVGQSTVRLLGRARNQRYFGKPRNHIRSKNRNFRIEKQGALVCLSWDNVGTTPSFLKSALNFNSSGGGTININLLTSSNEAEYVILTGNANFNELSIGDLVVVANMNSSGNNGTFPVTGVSDDGKTLRVLNPSAVTSVGESFVNGDFAASSEVSEGDTMILSSPFAILNQGKFRVIRRYNDSVWFENANVVEEEVTLPTSAVTTSVATNTSLKIDATNHSIYLNWNGTGTEPLFGNVQVGDIATFGVDFLSANRGDFMVLRSGAKLQEITTLTMPAGTQFTVGGAGKYFTINSAGNTNQYYVWFSVNASNSDPIPGGLTAIPVAILSGDNATQVATKTAVAISLATGLAATSSVDIVTVTTAGFQETTDAANFNMPAPFVATVSQHGRRTFIECVNPSAAAEAAVLPAGSTFSVHRPQMQFFEYEASVPGDQFVVTGDTLGLANAGTYNILTIIDRENIVVDQALVAVTNVSLNGRETSVYVQEGIAYTGYKHILFASQQPGSPNRNLVTFDTTAQYSKINESASVNLTSLNKADYVTTIRKGLDSYRYNTGLIAEANRIIYGDPRDPSTYPGVGAAGAEIFVREPLVRRVQVAIEVRINTGVPFAQTVEQVRTSVSSLVNSNAVGQPIAISDIISAVNAIPGVRAVSISSPQYDSTHDIIFVAPSEKARIIDPVLDVSVSQIGT